MRNAPRPRRPTSPAPLPNPAEAAVGAGAEPLYKRSLVVREKALGLDHPDVAQSLENYADLLRKTGRDDEAKELEARAKAIRSKHAKENSLK